MRYDPLKHHRRSIRLKNYNYASPGAYFITICTQENGDLLAHLAEQHMVLSPLGRIVDRYHQALPNIFHRLRIDHWVIMPDHFHAIWVLSEVDGSANPVSISGIVRNFKSVTTRRINRQRGSKGHKFWQRNYYERVIRNDQEWNDIRQYIECNPIFRRGEVAPMGSVFN